MAEKINVTNEELSGEFDKKRVEAEVFLKNCKANKQLTDIVLDLHESARKHTEFIIKSCPPAEEAFNLANRVSELLGKKTRILYLVKTLERASIIDEEFDKTLKCLNILCNSQWTKANVFMKEK